LFGLTAVYPLAAQAEANSIESVSYASLPGDEIQIKLTMSGAASVPQSFTINEPSRIALDFANTSSNLDKKTQTIGIGIARSLNAVQVKDRTRIVVNLVRMVPYNVAVEGNDVILTLSQSGMSTASSASASTAAAGDKALAATRSIENIDFRRGEQGEGRVIITLSDASIPVDLREEAGQIIVDFINSGLPENLERRLDVMDFATPVRLVDTYAQGNNVRMVIDPVSPAFEHLAYQSDTVFTVDLKPLSQAEQEKRRRDRMEFTGEKLSLNFQNIEVRAVLQLLADFAGFNLVTSDSVTGNVTLRLKNVPWDQALDIILKTRGLAKRETGNVVLVAPVEEIAAREKLEMESLKQVEELAPLRSEIIQLKYADAQQMVSLLQATKDVEAEGQDRQSKTASQSFLSNRGSVIADARTNSLLIQDTADKLREIYQLIETLDTPVRQVMIESRLVAATNDFSKDLGVRFGVSKAHTTDDTGIGVSNNVSNANAIASGNLGNPGASALNVNLPAIPDFGTAASIGLAVARLPLGYLLQLEISALEGTGNGEVLSNPRVVTSNGQEAYVLQGNKVPFTEIDINTGIPSISLEDVVLELRVTPTITPDDKVSMDLFVKQDFVDGEIISGDQAQPLIARSEASTTVLVDNGETLVLGGVYQQNNGTTITRVPFLGDLPYVGWLFKQKSITDDKSELLIFVTPKILDDKIKGTKSVSFQQ
jgi:type IV pilus assembly protein PilQ